MQWLAVAFKAVVAFAATNIDDIFILTFFFAQKNLKGWRVVLGQYLGIAGLVAISLVGFFARFVIPHGWIGLLGLAPIAIGVKKIIDSRREQKHEDIEARAGSVLTVAAVTFANGGDNIAIYTPLFASSDVLALLTTLLVFAVMIGIWCALGYYAGTHRVVRGFVDHYGHMIVPFVLVGLGLYIIFGSR